MPLHIDHPAIRVAVVSTPRSGNTWIRAMLATALGVPHHAWQAPADVDPATLPPGFVLQMHQRYETAYSDWLAGHRFHVLTIARHPFDVLISILHFCRHDSSPSHWLGGWSGSEITIREATPRSRTFLDYATGPRARDLLAVSSDWWNRPGVVRTRYEEFVSNPTQELARAVGRFGTATADLDAVVEAHAIGNLRPQVTNHHFWQGRPGLWRSLLTRTEVTELTAAHATSLSTFGYSADADPTLTSEAADRNWATVVAPDRRIAA